MVIVPWPARPLTVWAAAIFDGVNLSTRALTILHKLIQVQLEALKFDDGDGADRAAGDAVLWGRLDSLLHEAVAEQLVAPYVRADVLAGQDEPDAEPQQNGRR